MQWGGAPFIENINDTRGGASEALAYYCDARPRIALRIALIASFIYNWAVQPGGATLMAL